MRRIDDEHVARAKVSKTAHWDMLNSTTIHFNAQGLKPIVLERLDADVIGWQSVKCITGKGSPDDDRRVTRADLNQPCGTVLTDHRVEHARIRSAEEAIVRFELSKLDQSGPALR
jgi:hypothetical protein